MREIISEHKGFMAQVMKLSKSNLIKQFKGAALGPLWAVIKPAVTIFVYWFAFSVGLRKGSDVRGVSFFIFLTTGMIPWFFMHSAIIDGANCLRANRHFVIKMPFPVSTIPTFTMLSAMYVQIGLTALLYVLLLILGVKPSVYNLQIFYYMPMMFFFFLFLSWVTAPLSALSRDFLNVIKAIITALFWLSGIIWDPYATGHSELFIKVITANPITYIANGYRNTFLYNKWFFETPYETLVFVAWMVVMALLGSYVYKRLRHVIPDVL